MGGSRSGSALQCAVVTACSAGVFCFTGEQRLTNRLINIESGRLIRFQPACQRQSRGVRDHCLGRTRHRVSSGLRPAERSSARLKSPAAAQAVRPVLLCRALAVRCRPEPCGSEGFFTALLSQPSLHRFLLAEDSCGLISLETQGRKLRRIIKIIQMQAGRVAWAGLCLD